MDIHFHSHISGKLDKNKGTIRDVSIISEGPALGHGVTIDKKTLSQIYELQKSQPLSAHWTHGEGELGTETGHFSAFHIDGTQLRAHFTALDSWRQSYASRFSYLFELAEKAPRNFGVSIHFSGEGVWVLDDGSEVSADKPRPVNAVGDMPVVRVFKMHSADWVKSPAANSTGVFEVGKLTSLLDTKDKLSADVSAITEKLAASLVDASAKGAALAELTSKHEAAVNTFEADRAAFAAKETEFAAQKAALDAKVSELSAHIVTLSATVEAAKKAEADADKAHKEQIATLNRTLVEFGAIPVNIYSEVIDHFSTWAAITDPASKTAYFRKHQKEILGTG